MPLSLTDSENSQNSLLLQIYFLPKKIPYYRKLSLVLINVFEIEGKIFSQEKKLTGKRC